MVCDVAPDVQIERLVLMLFDELNRAIENRRVAAALARRSLLLRRRFHGSVGPEVGDAVCARLQIRADVPFADVPRGISGLMQQIRYGHAITETRSRRISLILGRELARHKSRAARAASYARHIELPKDR